jgi:hypothetical protein
MSAEGKAWPVELGPNPLLVDSTCDESRLQRFDSTGSYPQGGCPRLERLRVRGARHAPERLR